jgi:hypothetical protein
MEYDSVSIDSGHIVFCDFYSALLARLKCPSLPVHCSQLADRRPSKPNYPHGYIPNFCSTCTRLRTQIEAIVQTKFIVSTLTVLLIIRGLPKPVLDVELETVA